MFVMTFRDNFVGSSCCLSGWTLILLFFPLTGAVPVTHHVMSAMRNSRGDLRSNCWLLEGRHLSLLQKGPSVALLSGPFVQVKDLTFISLPPSSSCFQCFVIGSLSVKLYDFNTSIGVVGSCFSCGFDSAAFSKCWLLFQLWL